MDGTYATALKFYQQLCVILPPHECGLSKAYCRERVSVYEEFVNSVIAKCENLGFNIDPTIPSKTAIYESDQYQLV